MLLAWAALAHLAVTFLNKGWPASISTLARDRSLGDQTVGMAVMEWIAVCPYVVIPAVILLAGFELRHRALFEREMTRAIGEEDMRHVQGYYGLAKEDDGKDKVGRPAQRSGFWVLEYDNRIIGAVGLDGRKPGAQLDSMVDLAVDASAKGQDATGTPGAGTPSATSTATGPSANLRSRHPATKLDTTSLPTPKVSVTPPTPSSATFASASTVHLRRFAASRSFRPAGIEADLLSHAARAAFAPSPAGAPGPAEAALNVVVAARPSVQWELVGELLKAGFELVPKSDPLELEVRREEPMRGLAGRVAELAWPLDLGWRTYVLKKEVWEGKQANDAK